MVILFGVSLHEDVGALSAVALVARVKNILRYSDAELHAKVVANSLETILFASALNFELWTWRV